MVERMMMLTKIWFKGGELFPYQRLKGNVKYVCEIKL